MPPKKVQESYLFVLDLFMNNIEHVKKVFYRILIKLCDDKVRNKTKDVFKIILVGSKDMDNVNKFSNITVFRNWNCFGLQYILDELMHDLENVERGDRGDVFQGIELAAEHILYDEIVENHSPKSIIVFSDFLFDTPTNVSDDSLKINLHDIWLYVLGPSVKTPKVRSIRGIKRWSQTVEPALHDLNLRRNIQILNRIKRNGIVADLDVGSELVHSYVPFKKPYPWYCDLEIGCHISMKVNVFKMVQDMHDFKLPSPEPAYQTYEAKNKTWFNPDTGDEVEEPVKAYKFKGKYVCLTEEQKVSLDKKYNEDKCFQLKYFVKAEDVVSPLYFEENSLSAVVADVRQSECWHRPLRLLAESMHKNQVAAVVKRVYAKGPQFREKPYLMFTCPDHGPDCLLLAQLPFHHEFREDVNYYQDQLERKLGEFEYRDEDVRKGLDKYLSDMTIGDEDMNEHKLYCFPQHLLQNPNYNSQIDHVVKSLLVEDEFDLYSRQVVDFEVPEFLEERSTASFEEMERSKLLPLPSNEKTLSKLAAFFNMPDLEDA